MRPIDADELLKTLRENNAPYREDINRAIIYAPTIDPVRHGKWEEREADAEHWQSAKCSVCGRYHTTPYMYSFKDYNYCPNCGAKMDGGEE